MSSRTRNKINPNAAQFFEFEEKSAGPSPTFNRQNPPLVKPERVRRTRNKINPNAAQFFIFEEKSAAVPDPVVTATRRPRSFTASELNKVGVTLINDPTCNHLECQQCGCNWFVNQPVGSKRFSRGYWHCPNGCNKPERRTTV